jgi:hypothetical protein
LRLTVRYVAEDDTFAVVDVSQRDRLLQGGFKKSSDAQRFADSLFEEESKSPAVGER